MTHFSRILSRSFSQIGRRPGPHAMAGLALCLACFLAGGFGMFLASLDGYMADHLGHAQFQIYWKPGADMKEVRAQWEAIRTSPGVDRFIGFTPDEALASLAKSLGKGLDLSFMEGDNPLPPTGLASFRVSNGDPAPSALFLERLKAMPGVREVRLNPLQLDVAQAARSLSARVLIPLSLSLCAVIAAVAYLASRLCLEGRRSEVEIMRLVGAGEWFVRLPWATGAAATGLAGSLAGLGVLRLAQAALAPVLHAPPLWIRLVPLPFEEAAAMVLMATAMSALGGWLAARK